MSTENPNNTNNSTINKDRRMGLIQMGSVDEAVEILINLHNYPIEGVNMRVSFSRNTPTW